jgi:anthranilate phosphoribosyltransferase
MTTNTDELRVVFGKLANRQNLTTAEAQSASAKIFADWANNKPDTLGEAVALFGGLTIKGATVEELVGTAKAMEATKQFTFHFNTKEPLVTAGGTGGDTNPTINVTTPAIITAAAAGAYALKSGAKAFSSKTGSSDVAQELGINIHATPQIVQKCVEKIKVTAWASEDIYPWMGPLIASGKKEQTAAVMPLLYSLRLVIASALNPFSIKRQVRGVSTPVTETIAQVLSQCGYEKALVVLGYGENENTRIDEVSSLGKTVISEIKINGTLETYELFPEDIGIKRGSIKEVASRDSHAQNAQVAFEILSGRDQSTRRDMILMNAAAVLYVADKVKDFKDGYELAQQAIDEGKAAEKLRQLVLLSKGQLGKLEKLAKAQQTRDDYLEVP